MNEVTFRIGNQTVRFILPEGARVLSIDYENLSFVVVETGETTRAESEEP